MNNRNYTLGAVVLAVAAIALISGFWFGRQQQKTPASPLVAEKPLSAEKLLPLSLETLDGGRQLLTDWQGDVLLVNFWATWCAPCLEEIPLLVATQELYGSKGFRVVGIAIDQKDAVRLFADEIGINYPVLLGEKDGMNMMQQYGNRGGLPFSLVFDRSGRLSSTKLGIYSAEELREAIDKLL